VTDPVDVVAIVDELRAEVERRRGAGEYDEHVLRALHEEFGADFNEAPEAVAYVASSRPLASDRRAIGPATVFTMRVVRHLLAWYVAPIAEDQTRYNIASIRLIRSLEQRLAAIERALGLTDGAASGHPASSLTGVAELSSRLDRLERRMDELAREPRRSHRG
jgi:hypothetical protein